MWSWRARSLVQLLEKQLVRMLTACRFLRVTYVSEETRAGKLLDENQRHSPRTSPLLSVTVSGGFFLKLFLGSKAPHLLFSLPIKLSKQRLPLSLWVVSVAQLLFPRQLLGIGDSFAPLGRRQHGRLEST